MSGTIFERYGGASGIAQLVATHCASLLEHDRLAHRFAQLDMDRVQAEQIRFMTALSGGPEDYEDDSLKQVYAELDLSNAEFEMMLGLYSRSMIEHGYTPSDIDVILSNLTRKRHVLVSQTPA